MKYLRRTIPYFLALLIIIPIIFNFPALAQDEHPLLRQGMRGEAVWELQQLLNDLGYNIDVDGYFGAQTETIVRAFQDSFALSTDGVVGEETWTHLRQANPFLSYTVITGDTLTSLARKFDTTISAIKLANGMDNDFIYAGQKLFIPRSWMGGSDVDHPAQRINYRVEKGDSLWIIANRFQVSIDDIKKENNLRSDIIYQGQTIRIPRNDYSGFKSIGKGEMIWPATGRISSPFGYRIHPIYGNRQFHSGIDIALTRGTKIRAAASGVVTTSAWLGGYGLTIVIDHGDGISTLYGHNDSLLVRAGAFVVTGQVIALSGNTGVSSGPHLHFEVRENNRVVDPIKYLIPR